MLEHFLVLTSGLIFNFCRQHKAIQSSTAIVILLPFGFVWINIPSRCRVRAFGSVVFLVQGDKPAIQSWRGSWLPTGLWEEQAGWLSPSLKWRVCLGRGLKSLETQWDFFFLHHIHICTCCWLNFIFSSFSWFEERKDQQLFEGLSESREECLLFRRPPFWNGFRRLRVLLLLQLFPSEELDGQWYSWFL